MDNLHGLHDRAHFGEFELDLETGELRREGGGSTPLPEQQFRILVVLLERAGEVVTREEMRKLLWPHDTVVQFEHGINAAINRLRLALSDTATQPKYLETLPRRGYRWRSPVEWVKATPEAAGVPGSPPRLETRAPDLAGKKISHYRILELLGGGGMGVVYRAEDIKLGRRVAMKFLPEELAEDANALERFEREARTASSLEHPNICPVYEFGEHEGQPFIVMQLLEGETLRERIETKGRFESQELLDVAIQITHGLDAAHSLGIVHRDIKPANIFLTQRGESKILDFGIATLARAERWHADAAFIGGSNRAASAAAFPPSGLTRTGATMGTAAYMSPEQVLGEKLDARTDLFSFGLVLYEMATGQKAFSGDSPELVKQAILNRKLVPPRDLNSQISPGFASIIETCTQKDRSLRYQHASEMLTDLERLTHEGRLAGVNKEAQHPATSRNWRGWWWLTGVGLVAVAAVVSWLRPWGKPTYVPARPIPLTTLPGAEWSPTFSPDGSQVAFVWNGPKQDNADVFVKVIGTDGEAPIRLTSDPAPDVDPAWSPDGRWIAVRRITPVGHEIILVSPLGASVERRICTLPCPQGHCSGNLWVNRLSWSADSKFLAVSDALSPHSPGGILLLDIWTREKRRLDFMPGGHMVSACSPAFSPDGTKLAFVAGEAGSEYIYTQTLDKSLLLVGPPRRLVQARVYPAIDWTADGQGLIFTSLMGGLWRISAHGGRSEQLQDFACRTLAVARQGKRLAYSASSPLGGVVANIHRADRQSEVGPFIASSHGNGSAQYSDDGNRVVIVGPGGLQVCSRDGTNCFQLNQNGGSPRFSPDGRYVAFDANEHGSWDIFIVRSDGGASLRLTLEDSTEARPSWSRDGKWIYFSSDRSGEFQIWRIPFEGGTARQVTRNGGFEAVEDRGGKAVYYVKRGEEGIWTIPVAGGDESLVLNQGQEGDWALGARGIYLLSKGPAPAIEYFDFAKRTVTRLRTLPVQSSIAMLGVGPEFAVSPDERWFLYGAVERNEQDLMLLENFRP